MKIKVELSFLVTLLALFLTNDPKLILFMLFSALVHELGHIFTLKLFGIRLKMIVLSLFGGTLVLDKKLISYGKEAIVAVSGCLVNIVFSIVFFAIIQRGFSSDVFFLLLSNTFYGIFNLLPISSLDGGAALKALLLRKKELYDAEKLASRISRVTLFALGVISLYLVSVSAFNVSLFMLVLLFYAESSDGQSISGYSF